MDKLSLRNFTSTQKRRGFLEKELNIKLSNIGQFSFSEDQVAGKNIENLIGATQIPLGIAGPVRISKNHVIPSFSEESSISSRKIASGSSNPRNDNVSKDYYIPLATTEGALVASISRGCKAISEAGGATVFIEDVGQTRGPVFKIKNLEHGIKTKAWIENNLKALSSITQETSSHLKLLKTMVGLVGNNLFVRFQYLTSDAMGMNMVTIATEKAVSLIEQKTKARCIALAGNFDIDKKPAWLNFILGRGKKVWAEVVLPKKVVKDVLKTTPDKITGVVLGKNHLGSIMSGSLGFNAHYANILSAMFLATGQDLAHVVEGSLGVTTCEILEDGNLSFSIYLPCLVVGTVGGGTNLPTQKEALEIMKITGVLEYAQCLAAAVLAGELSLIASLSEGSLATAHQRLGRKETI